MSDSASDFAFAEIVIIGGGAVGCSIAYHLAQMGKRDVLLLEKAQLTHGSTWHAAGLVGQLRGKQSLTRMMQYSADLYGRLEAETGQATDWHPVGSLRLASSEDRWLEIQRTATTARSFGFELHLVSASEARQLFPFIDTEGVIGAAFIPSDGYVDPTSLTQAYAKGARQGGVRIEEGVLVTGFESRDRRVVALETDKGRVVCEQVINAAGMWARQIGALAGVSVPAGTVEHQYIVTEKHADIAAGLPTLRDPDKNFYLKPEAGSFAIGGWEDDTLPFGIEGIDFDFGRTLFPENLERFEQILLPTAERLPILNELGIRQTINGPIPVSPDGEPVMGLAPERDNFWVACGFTAGIAASGGAGRAMAEWLVEGAPSFDLWSFDLRRFGKHHASPGYLHERAVESYGRYYKIHWPLDESQVGRGLRRSPLHGTLAAAGAVHGTKFGWERPNWFTRPGEAGRDLPTFGRPNCFAAVAAEAQTVRSAVGLIDQSSFAKLRLTGPGALAALERLAVSRIDKPVGAAIYTQMLNPAGGIECDLTICRRGPEDFLIVTGSGFGVHDGDWIARHLPDDGSARLEEVTAASAVINICGPQSRAVLGAVTDAALDSEAFPFAACREIAIGPAPVLAIRLGYVGELGWELHIPPDMTAFVYQALMAAGAAHKIANVGYRAVESLRLEKGYLYWSSDITPKTDPLSAGLGARIAWSKEDFIGRDALLRRREEGAKTRLSVFTLEEEVQVFGNEPVLCDGEVIAVTTSGGYGHTLAKPIVYAYLPMGLGARDDFEVEAFGRRVAAIRHEGPLYDPDNERLKA